ncbi:hypothetical protein HN734_04675 [Candidatus Woesearchaeota archaeon]|nr:hypothetical protein [Candidatus Woesearchaeota archaeon]
MSDVKILMSIAEPKGTPCLCYVICNNALQKDSKVESRKGVVHLDNHSFSRAIEYMWSDIQKDVKPEDRIVVKGFEDSALSEINGNSIDQILDLTKIQQLPRAWRIGEYARRMKPVGYNFDFLQ